jgi:hypothetical protein
VASARALAAVCVQCTARIRIVHYRTILFGMEQGLWKGEPEWSAYAFSARVLAVPGGLTRRPESICVNFEARRLRPAARAIPRRGDRRRSASLEEFHCHVEDVTANIALVIAFLLRCVAANLCRGY